MGPPGDEALYASPPSSPGPATTPLCATLLNDCEVSPLSLPAARFLHTAISPVFTTQLPRPELDGAKKLAFTLPTPSPPVGRRNAIAQGMLATLILHDKNGGARGEEREDECLEPGTSCICCFPQPSFIVADSEKDTNSNDEYNTINNLDSYTMARCDPRRKSSPQNEYDYDDASSEYSACGPNELPGNKLSDTSPKGDLVLFKHRLANIGIVYSDPAHPSFGNPIPSDKILVGSNGKVIVPAESNDDSTLNGRKMSSPTFTDLAYRPKRSQPEDYDTLSTNQSERAIRSNRANALHSSSNQASTWGSSLYGDSRSGVGSSNTAGRLTSGSSLLPRLRDSSLTTQYMPSSPPPLYRPPHARHNPPSPADIASIFAQRGHANANGQPPVRPFEPAQFIPDPCQTFAGLVQFGGYLVGAQYRGEHVGRGQTSSSLPYPPYPLLTHDPTARVFEPEPRTFIPRQLHDEFQHQQGQPYRLPPQPYLPLQPLPPPAPQPPYKDARIRSHSSGDTSNGNPHIPTHLNTCLWIEGLPPSTTYPSLLSSIHSCGRIFCTYINKPHRGHPTSACKVAFFSRAGAERLFEQCMRGEFVVGGVKVGRVRWNRNAYSGHPDPVATRCLLIRGPAKWVNLKTLTCYFQALFWWHLITVDDIPLDVAAKMAGDNGWLERGLRVDLAEEYREMAAMRWEFASFHAQAQAAKLACERETAFMGLVRVDYLPDGCDYTE